MPHQGHVAGGAGALLEWGGMLFGLGCIVGTQSSDSIFSVLKCILKAAGILDTMVELCLYGSEGC